MTTITSANSILSIAVNNLFGSPQIIQGYAVDDAFESESVAQSETMMGVDGKLSAGKVYTPYKMTIHLQANSPSIDMFETWRSQQDAQVDVFSASGSIILPAVLQPVVFEITWERIVPNPTA
jgi:hypothetical protein